MKKYYKLENLDCANCAAKMEEAVKNIEGVKDASVNFMMQKLMFETDEDAARILSQIKKVISRIEPDCDIVE